jgi:hypothetical protein
VTIAHSGRSRLRFVLAISVVFGMGLALRLDHLQDIWSSWMPAYARYARPHWLDMSSGVFPWDGLVGMHPPGWALLTATLVHLGASMRGLLALPLLAWFTSAVIGILLLNRFGGRLAALAFVTVLAIAPYQVHYSLELNNYPLFQLGTAALVVSIASTWNTPSRPRLFVLSLVVGANLWCHFASAPFMLALGVCAVVTKRWHLAGATVLGVLLASPILLEAGFLPGDSQTFHNEPLAGLALARFLLRLWRDAFVPNFATWSMLAATALAAGFALAAPRTRSVAFLLLMMLCVAVVWVQAGFSSGAAFYRQTPYWVGCSWLVTALLGLGVGAAPHRGKALLLLVLAPWLVGVGQRLAASPTDWDLSEAPEHVTEYLSDEVDPDAGDVVVYLWEGFLNDQPHLRDPFYSAFAARDLVPFVHHSEPFATRTSAWRGVGRLTQVGDAIRSDYEELAQAILTWTSGGRVVHLVQPGWERGRGEPNTDALRGRVTGEGVIWTEWHFEKATLVRLER